MKVTLIRSDDVVPEIPARSGSAEIELLTVGRIDFEKNPLLLVEALARLERAQPDHFRLRWVGTGPLEEAVRARARELGVLDRLDLCGYVPYGPELLARYRRADIFVHVSLTEGVPQVLLEALACATAIVATDVGGVRESLDGGRAGLLVPPSDLDALVHAIQRAAGDERLRARLIERGLELARTTTIEGEAERVASFLAGRAACA
jgi:glycosyltransferase involved in cell wall biosynthesis